VNVKGDFAVCLDGVGGGRPQALWGIRPHTPHTNKEVFSPPDVLTHPTRI